MRVLHLGNYAESAGGIASVLREYSSWDWPTAQLDFCNTYSNDLGGKGFRPSLSAFRELVRRRSCTDIVHVHLSQGGSFLREGGLLTIAQRLGYATVATLHGSNFEGFAQRHPKLVATTLSSADIVISLHSAADAIVESLLPGRSRIVPNGLKDTGPPPARSVDAMNTVLFAGEVSNRKGFDVLLAAWPRVVELCPDAILEVFGPPRMTIVAPPRSVLHGSRPRSEVAKRLQHGGIFALPSRAEAFPMSILEAMAASLPVVATNVAAIPAMLPQTSLLVPAGDVDALTFALADLVGKATSLEIGNRNRAHFLANFESGTVAGAMEDCYRSSRARHRTPKKRSNPGAPDDR
jgi:glycosyltransferase involved in cell wall biosynthesis